VLEAAVPGLYKKRRRMAALPGITNLTMAAAMRPPDPGQLHLKNTPDGGRRGFRLQIHRNLTVFGTEFLIPGWLPGENCFNLTFKSANSDFTPLSRPSFTFFGCLA